MLSASVRTLYNFRNYKSENECYPIHLEIKIDGKRRYHKIKVPQKVSPNQWCGNEDAWVKKNHPFFFEINNKIREQRNVVLQLIKRSYNFSQSLTFSVVFRELKKSSNTNVFNEFFERYNQHPTDDIDPPTLKKYNACLGHLNCFNKSIRFYELTPDLVENFYQYLKTKAKGRGKETLGLEGSTIDSYFDAFRKIVGLARKAHQISKEQEDTLFEDLHIDVQKSKRTFLTIDEIKLWREHVFDEDEQQHLIRNRDLYLLQIYTGFYYKDLINFKKKYLMKDHEHGYYILGERDKNGEQTIIPLYKFPYAATIIERYLSGDDCEYVIDRKYILSEAVYNRQLKDVASLVGIKKKVSNKVARHTNAQLWIRLGIKKHILKQMLGQTKDETTDYYFRVGFTEVVEGTKNIRTEDIGV